MKNYPNSDLHVNHSSFKLFYLVIILLILLRFAISSRLPTFLIPIAGHDDGLVIREAMSILNGQWLGPYDQYTLIKGVFASALLALSSILGISYGSLNTLIYCIAALYFTSAISSVTKSKFAFVIFFGMLLFNPITYALDTGQRIYRTGIGQWQILFILGSLITLFVSRYSGAKVLFKHALICGLALGFFVQTREDGLWIFPLVLFMLILLIALTIRRHCINNSNTLILMLPLVIPCVIQATIMLINFHHYGAPILNDRTGGNYSKVIEDIHHVVPDPFDELHHPTDYTKGQYYNIYRSTIEKAFLASPTLNSLKGPILEATQKWVDPDRPESNELPTDHMQFALRDGIRAAGYYKHLPETENLYQRIHEELQHSFSNGTLETRGFSISPLLVPLKSSDILNALRLMPIAVRNIANYSDVKSVPQPSIGPDNLLKETSHLAGGEYFTGPSGPFVDGAGWVFSHNDKVHLTAGLYDQSGKKIANLPLVESIDVYNLLLSKGYKYENAKKSRFSFRAEGYNINSGLTIRLIDKDGAIIRDIQPSVSGKCDGDQLIDYCIDYIKSEIPEQIFYRKFTDRANSVINIYKNIVPLLSLFGIVFYVYSAFLTIRKINRIELNNATTVFLILTGVGLTFLLFMFIMCVIQVTSFPALAYRYTAPAYLLLLIFCLLSNIWGVQNLYLYIKCKTI